MAGTAPDLSGYVDVAERLRAFFGKYPDGSLQATPPRVVELDGRRFIEVTVSAYRSPADPMPAVASAWEVWPGRTPYTKDSEPMNAETSAAGRALAFLGLEVHRSIATAQDVAARQEPRVDKVRIARLRAALAKRAKTPEAKAQLVALIMGRPAATFDGLDAEELDRLEQILEDLDAERARLELDEAGAPRIVAVEAGGPTDDA